jgi:hypothetical protein
MGEWSKKIGEYGENVVEKFLSIIGWNNVKTGPEIIDTKDNNISSDEDLNYRYKCQYSIIYK